MKLNHGLSVWQKLKDFYQILSFLWKGHNKRNHDRTEPREILYLKPCIIVKDRKEYQDRRGHRIGWYRAWSVFIPLGLKSHSGDITIAQAVYLCLYVPFRLGFLIWVSSEKLKSNYNHYNACRIVHPIEIVTEENYTILLEILRQK